MNVKIGLTLLPGVAENWLLQDLSYSKKIRNHAFGPGGLLIIHSSSFCRYILAPALCQALLPAEQNHKVLALMEVTQVETGKKQTTISKIGLDREDCEKEHEVG